MPKSSLSNRRPKEPFNPALEAPVALTLDQLETVVGGLLLRASDKGGGGATSGMVPPPPPPVELSSILRD
jgi:hypothetical protein